MDRRSGADVQPHPGWITYYGRYYKSALYPTLRYLDRRLARWAMAKYKRLKRHRRRAERWIRRSPCATQRSSPTGPGAAGRNDWAIRAGRAETLTSGPLRRLGVKLPRATRPNIYVRSGRAG